MGEIIEVVGKSRIRRYDVQLKDIDNLRKYPHSEAKIHVKRFDRTGKRHRFLVNTQFMIHGQMFVSQSEEWDCMLAIRECLGGIRSQYDKFMTANIAIAA
ncbi:hypothetical protein H6503_05460 [Candidatus Woesearchaeota archaeon]|nr:hypothetical protein [Candidatus Woesearchaeota archaeon]